MTLTGMQAGLLITSFFSLFNLAYWWKIIKDREWYKQNKAQLGFLRHSFCYWSIAWFLWVILYLVFCLSDGESPPLLVMLLSDLNSLCFFGFYVSYTRGNEYKWKPFALNAVLLGILLVLWSIGAYYLDFLDDKTQPAALYYAPSLVFSIYSYLFVSWAFYRRYRYHVLDFVFVSMLYAILQIPAQLEVYGNIELSYSIDIFSVLSGLKILVAVLFYLNFQKTMVYYGSIMAPVPYPPSPILWPILSAKPLKKIIKRPGVLYSIFTVTILALLFILFLFGELYLRIVVAVVASLLALRPVILGISDKLQTGLRLGPDKKLPKE